MGSTCCSDSEICYTTSEDVHTGNVVVEKAVYHVLQASDKKKPDMRLGQENPLKASFHLGNP